MQNASYPGLSIICTNAFETLSADVMKNDRRAKIKTAPITSPISCFAHTFNFSIPNTFPTIYAMAISVVENSKRTLITPTAVGWIKSDDEDKDRRSRKITNPLI